MMQEGTHKVKPISAFYGESGKKTAYIGIVFENDENDKITHKLWLNSTKHTGGENEGKSNAEVAFETLAKCGFTGDADDLADENATGLFKPVKGGIEVVIAHEDYTQQDEDGNYKLDDNGDPIIKTYAKIEYLNIGERKSSVKRLDKDMAQKVSTKYKANAFLNKFKKAAEANYLDEDPKQSDPEPDNSQPEEDDDCPF